MKRVMIRYGWGDGWMAVGRVGRARQRMEDGWMMKGWMDGWMAFYYGAVPQSVIARRSSGFRRKSRNPVLWMPT